MKLRVLCIQLGVGMEGIRVSAECRSHLSLSLHPYAAPSMVRVPDSQVCVGVGVGGGNVHP